MGPRHRLFASIIGLATAPLPALAQAPANEAGAANRENVPSNSFALGEIIVTGAREADQPIVTGSIVSAPAMERFNRVSLDEAVNLMPGVSASNSGGSRNERLIFVRGFDRFQVPLSMDGIRVYLPADNRLDMGRFLTPDVAQVQVAKGYASVLDGPGAMGGAINLVTRTPTKALEVEARGTISLDRDADYAGYNVFGLIGTRQDKWYAQASYTRNRVDHWDLAGGYAPTTNQAAGERDLSDTSDWRVNAKIGFTPNATDDYALSYTRQEGAKNAPIETTVPLPAQRYWQWPYWNIESLYFLSTTALSDDATLKTRVYHNSFDNLLRAFDQRGQTSQTLARAFNSYYADKAFGGSAQFDLRLPANNRLSIAFFYRRDRHDEWQQVFPSGRTEPRQRTVEDTYSAAIEDEIAFTPSLSLTLGASYDWRDLGKAQDYAGTPGAAGSGYVNYPLRNAQAINGQGRLSWHPDETRELYASLSSRTRFPTLFERFSSRFGGATSNPDLQSERATQAEAGGRWQFGSIRLEGAAYYAWLGRCGVRLPADLQRSTCDSEPQHRLGSLLWRRSLAGRTAGRHADSGRQLQPAGA
ncbi:TonB-dependent receptor plug domain-containing protein [Sphingobium sp. CR28]|uniref:TonB-dependent receptor plug domain-containing protein n=1 Tax=Sphingobium sp. CR28 TaxID=3400272 RepID=UPI003FEF7793